MEHWDDMSDMSGIVDPSIPTAAWIALARSLSGPEANIDNGLETTDSSSSAINENLTGVGTSSGGSFSLPSPDELRGHTPMSVLNRLRETIAHCSGSVVASRMVRKLGSVCVDSSADPSLLKLEKTRIATVSRMYCLVYKEIESQHKKERKRKKG